jgi:uncharacterized protein YndB with AHSA1/START domain
MRVSRLIRAPKDQVFAAFLDPAALVAWLPPKGMRGSMLRFDPWPGGGYAMALAYERPDARAKTTADSDTAEVRFIEIEPERRIVQAVDFETERPDAVGTMTMTWSFTDADGGVLASVEVENAPPAIRPDDHEIGIRSSLEQLDRYLSAP